jgi:type IV secretory pathway TrbF-like protein
MEKVKASLKESASCGVSVASVTGVQCHSFSINQQWSDRHKGEAKETDFISIFDILKLIFFFYGQRVVLILVPLFFYIYIYCWVSRVSGSVLHRL